VLQLLRNRTCDEIAAVGGSSPIGRCGPITYARIPVSLEVGRSARAVPTPRPSNAPTTTSFMRPVIPLQRARSPRRRAVTASLTMLPPDIRSGQRRKPGAPPATRIVTRPERRDSRRLQRRGGGQEAEVGGDQDRALEAVHAAA